MHYLHVLPLLLAIATPPASAQGAVASSEGFVAIAPIQPGGVAVASSASYSARMTVGLAPSGVTAISAQLVMHAGTAALQPKLTPGAPLVLAALPSVGDRAGGEPLTIRGFNLDDGSGTALALVGGAPASGVTATSNTVLAATTGAGVNPFGNPLGAVDVAVTSSAGTGTRANAFVYAPALAADAAPRVGQIYPLHVHLPAGSFYQLVFGKSVAGFAVPLPPLGGAAEVLVGIVPLTGLLPAATDRETLPLPIPDSVGLIGLSIELQAAVLTGFAPLAGTFTNRLKTVVAP
jgi:hypothetical protein